ncbi:MAG: hypothetical protein ACLP9C_02130 [Acidimicrobiales bacterium]
MGVLAVMVPGAWALVGALVNLSGPGHYLNWGWVHISYANLTVILLMIVVFVAAILIPFRRHKRSGTGD